VGQIIAFSIKDECVTPDTEVLTPEGWKYISEIEEGITKVAQFNPETKEIDFVIPSRIVKKEYQGNIVHYNSEKLRIEQKLTENHDMLVGYDRNPGVFQKVKAIDFEPQTHRTIPVSGFKSNTTKKTLSDYERLLIAIQADGFISDRYTGSRSGTVPVTFSFSKQRKIKRLTDLLDRLTFSYSITPREGYGNKKDQLVFKVDVPISYPVYKTFEEWVKLEELDQNWCNEFLDELVKWDGSVKDGESDYYSSTIKSNVDIVQAIASFCGKFVTMYIQEDNRKETFSTVYRSRIHNMDVKRTGGVTKTLVPYDGLVYCVTVPTSAFVIRVNGAVSITGNCLHSEAGCWLFRQLVAEFPDIWTDELKKDLYDAARLTVELEDNFIDKVFELGSIEGLDPKDLKTFIRHRCNTKLQDIGLKSNWKNLDKESLKRMEWFDTMSVGVSQQDFFAGRVDSYSRGNKDWDSIF
jgi:ribonucleotide reductase beta subunit family protein with ferritin-like domain